MRHNNSVTGLTADDFLLLDDVQPQAIHNFADASGYAPYTGRNMLRE